MVLDTHSFSTGLQLLQTADGYVKMFSLHGQQGQLQQEGGSATQTSFTRPAQNLDRVQGRGGLRKRSLIGPDRTDLSGRGAGGGGWTELTGVASV